MLNWLLNEMEGVRTPKFHLIDGPVPVDTRQAMEAANVAVPPSYKAFVLRLGNVRLYRRDNVYLVQVFAAPREIQHGSGELLLHFGRTDSSLAYFKRSLLVPGGESPVYEWQYAVGLREAADGFEDWLMKKCNRARKRFSNREWAAIRDGPPPFNDRESAIAKARGQFRWRVVGVTKSGDLLFEVHNGSQMILPFLTIGIRQKAGDPLGAVWLPVSAIAPGQTGLVSKDCYKEHHSPGAS